MKGALVGGRCFASQESAADVFYSSAAPSQTPGAITYLSEFVKVSGSWRLRRYQVDANGKVAVLSDATLLAKSFPPCDPAESFKDGMAVGWGVVAAMLLAWCVVVTRRGL